MRLAGDEVWTQPAATDAVGGQSDLTADEVWHLVLAVRRRRDQQRGDDGCWGFRRDGGGWVLAAEQVADLLVDPKRRSIHWLRVQPDAPGLAIVDLHLGHALCDRGRGCVVAVLGQSLDGYIATCGGDSRYINGPESLVHLHRVRALSDAVLVGVGTALADAPRLTTRHVVGPSATRVVLDPKGRLPPTSGLLGDGLAPTIVVRATTERAASRRLTEQATLLSLPAVDGMIPPADVVAALAALGVGRAPGGRWRRHRRAVSRCRADRSTAAGRLTVDSRLRPPCAASRTGGPARPRPSAALPCPRHGRRCSVRSQSHALRTQVLPRTGKSARSGHR